MGQDGSKCGYCHQWIDRYNSVAVELSLDNGKTKKKLTVHQGVCEHDAKEAHQLVCACCKGRIAGHHVKVEEEEKKNPGEQYVPRKKGRVHPQCVEAFRRHPGCKGDAGKCQYCRQPMGKEEHRVKLSLPNGKNLEVHSACSTRAQVMFAEVCGWCKGRIAGETQTMYKCEGPAHEGGCPPTPLHPRCVNGFKQRRLPPPPQKR
mmetsp:Transcript_41560/g.81977  ORF Transcript_41560/g.81977 Transcript_41560/m.81977 type:complete len:204 (+) Transcript_41560:145-756(+)